MGSRRKIGSKGAGGSHLGELSRDVSDADLQAIRLRAYFLTFFYIYLTYFYRPEKDPLHSADRITFNFKNKSQNKGKERS